MKAKEHREHKTIISHEDHKISKLHNDKQLHEIHVKRSPKIAKEYIEPVEIPDNLDEQEDTKVTDLIFIGHQHYQVGHFATIGKRPTMEDSTSIVGDVIGNGSQYYAVFDGHGGDEVAKYCSRNLYKEFAHRYENAEKIQETLKASILEMNKDLIAKYPECGSTAAIVVVANDIIYTANMGDARIIISNENNQIKRLSYDHRASDPYEKKLIEAKGGKVFMGRIYGMLMVSRCLGDGIFDGLLINEPYMTKTTRKNGMILIIGCDGVWDVMRDDEAMNIAKEAKSPEEAAQKIVKEALDRGSTDNVSCVVVNLSK
ncbi:Protein phosphatase 2C 1 [Tritrichomonas foetus]|uniref:Protein phosphatase 2C 1 n=1 Tax=Tritrichomonas foetus TaxID=1144522 RepID=A0A1J4JBV7_9EUKA|nr:Protein phosphatase 2C 1 [Tritrichomonas foetus]|eukprot:OHS95139.1 Protein phosphatase 2C 1 [Tritrichomonas foetus]